MLTALASPKDIGPLASKMLGYNLVTKQTPAGGVLVNKVKFCVLFGVLREALTGSCCPEHPDIPLPSPKC